MKIWRTLFADCLKDIDYENFGCHWTKDSDYGRSAEFNFSDISEGQSRSGKHKYTFEATIDESMINHAATKKSNEEHSSESECVLFNNTRLQNVEEVNWLKGIIVKSINTGTRCDSWVREMGNERC